MRFVSTNSTPPDPPSELSMLKLQILSAWHWLVRIQAKEAALNAAVSSGASMSDLEGPFDLAYRCVLPAPLGYAIHKVEAPPVPEPVIEEVATLLDASRVTKESEDTTALWKSQRPAIVVVTTLALGLRKLCAEVRRRVDAWKTLAGSSTPLIHGSQLPSTDLFSPL